MRRSTLGFLLVLSVTLLAAPRAPAGAASSNILTTPQKAAPQLQKPQPNPKALQSTPALVKAPGFQIGYIIPSRAGFQPCSAGTGFLGTVWDNSLHSVDWSNLYCAKGNVSVSQTNPLINMTGKKLRLLVTSWSYSYALISNWTTDLSVYELPFQQKGYVTFQVVFASSHKFEVTYSSYDPRGVQERKDYANAGFAQGKPVKFDAVYDGTTYATLNCTFKSPNKMDC